MASDEEVDSELATDGGEDLYQCETCPVARALDDLDDENREAWRIFQQTITRFTVDTHLAGLVLEKAAGDWPTLEFQDLVDRLTIIYDAVCPPPKRESD